MLILRFLSLITVLLLPFDIYANSLRPAQTLIVIDNSAADKITLDFSWRNKIILKSALAAASGEISAAVKFNDLDLGEFPLLREKIMPVSFISGIIKNGDLTLVKEDIYSIKGTLEIESLKFSYPIQQFPVKNANDNLIFQGNLSLSGLFNLPVLPTKDFLGESSYFLKGETKTIEIQNSPLLDTLYGINAEFTCDNKKFAFAITDSTYPQKVYSSPSDQEIKTPKTNKLSVKGEILYGQDKSFLLEAKTALPFSQFITAVQEIQKMPFQYRGSGEIALNSIVKGVLGEKISDYHIDYTITAAAVGDFTNINASGFVKTDALIAEEISLNYKDIPLKAKARVDNFASPDITLSLDTGQLNINAQANYHSPIIDVTALSIKGNQTNLTSKAYIDLTAPVKVKIEGLGSIDCQEIIALLPSFKLSYPFLEKLNPQGNLSLKFLIEGNMLPTDWTIKVAAVSKELNIYNIAAQETTIELYRDKNEITISPLTAVIGGGETELRAKFDFLNNWVTFNAAATDIELNQIRDYLKLKNKTLEGKLSLEIYLQNAGIAQWNKLSGEGKVLIHDGNLWQFNLLKGLGEILYIPSFETIIFDQGYSNLIFEGENIVFKDLKLTSPQITIQGEGTLSTKGDINIKLSPQLSPLLISESNELQNLINHFLGKSALGVELTGTIGKPKYNVTSIFTSPVKGITGILESILGGDR